MKIVESDFLLKKKHRTVKKDPKTRKKELKPPKLKKKAKNKISWY